MNEQAVPAAGQEPIVWRLNDQHESVLAIVVDGLALIRSMLPDTANAAAPPDIAGSELDATIDLAQSVRTLAKVLVEDLATAGASDSRSAQRSDATDVITSAIVRAGFRMSRARRDEAFADARDLVRETGLEYLDLDLALGPAEPGGSVIVGVPVARPVAYASLVGRLFQRADSFMSIDDNLIIERAASSWFFFRWSDGTQDGDREYTDFPRMVREQEWSLVSRDTIALEEPIIASFTEEQKADDVPPRQRRLASAYLRSTVGIFDVTHVDGPRVTVRDALTEQTFQYYEHSEDAQPYAGLMILGRLIPIDETLWIRSPGALIISPPDPAFRDLVIESLTTLSKGLPTPIALEALISTIIYGADVPVRKFPAPTITQAEAAFVEAMEGLEELGLIEDMPEGEVPPDLLGQLDSPGRELVGLSVDQAMAEWLAALMEQMSLGSTRERSTRKGKHKRSKSHHKKRRKH